MAYLVRACTYRKGKDGKDFANLVLLSETMEAVSCYCFECEGNLRGSVIEIAGGLPAPNAKGFVSFNFKMVTNLGVYAESKELQDKYYLWYDYKDKVPTYGQFCDIVDKLFKGVSEKRESVCNIVRDKLPALYGLYSKAPASRAMHHAYRGGLAQHTYEMLCMLLGVGKTCGFEVDLFICTLGILYHDYGKLYEYNEDYTYTEEMVLRPHLVSSAEYFRDVYKDIVDEHTMRYVQHIIYSHHGKLEFGSACLPATIEAFMVSQLDILSAHGSQWGCVGNMERSFAMDNRILVQTVSPDE